MCSSDGGWSLLWSHASNSHELKLGQSGEEDFIWCFAFSFVGRLVAYIALLGVLIVVISLITRFIFGDCEGDHRGTSITDNDEPSNDEARPFFPHKTIPITYGTCGEEDQDLEAGNYGSCSTNNNNRTSNTGRSSEDLYDGKICVICFDEPRSCFFVPCGHCATCHDCAIRIFYGETRTCPVCRRFVGKVRKLSK